MFFRFSITPLVIFAIFVLVGITIASPLNNKPHARALHAKRASTENNEKTANYKRMTLVPQVQCNPSNGSPLLSHAREAAGLLINMEDGRCAFSGDEMCKQMHCVKSACIGRCAANKGSKSSFHTCKELAGFAKQVIEKPECWMAGDNNINSNTTVGGGGQPDKQRIGGMIRVYEEYEVLPLDFNDVNVYFNPAWKSQV